MISGSTIGSIAVSADGKRIITGGCTDGCDSAEVLFWLGVSNNNYSVDLFSHATALVGVAGVSGATAKVHISADGKRAVSYVIFGGGSGNTLVWRLRELYPNNDAPGSTPLYIGYTSHIAFSPDGKFVTSGEVDSSQGQGITGIPLWNPLTEDITAQLQDGTTDPSIEAAQSFSPDSKVLASWNNTSRVITLWDVLTRRIRSHPFKTGPDVSSVIFSPDLRVVAAMTNKGSVILYDLQSGRELHRLSMKDEVVTCMAFSSNGKKIIAGTDKNHVAIWDAQSGTLIAQPASTFTSGLRDVAFSPNSRLLAAQDDQTILIWDAKTMKLINQLHPPSSSEDTLGKLAFSPDGQTLASSLAFTVLLWNTTSGLSIAPSPLQAAHPDHATTGSLNDLKFSPDGKVLAAVNQRGIFFWDTDVNSWQSRACRIANRNFTADEWLQYADADNTKDIKNYRKVCQNLPVDRSSISLLLGNAESATQKGEQQVASTDFIQATKWAVESQDDDINDEVCWRGSIAGFASIVLPTCNRTQRLVPGDGGYQDSRGLARALVGDFAGASEDFTASIQWLKDYPFSSVAVTQARMQERQSWLDALKAGQNPFNSTTLHKIRNEKHVLIA